MPVAVAICVLSVEATVTVVVVGGEGTANVGAVVVLGPSALSVSAVKIFFESGFGSTVSSFVAPRCL